MFSIMCVLVGMVIGFIFVRAMDKKVVKKANRKIRYVDMTNKEAYSRGYQCGLTYGKYYEE